MPDPSWLSRDVVISTPEAVDFTWDLAGPGHRFLAWLLDVAILGILTVGLVMTCMTVFFSASLFSASFVTAAFLLHTGYFIVLEARWHGQTPGKRVVGIRVMDARGFRVSPAQCAVRNLFRVVDSFPLLYLAGGLTSLASRRGLRFGDLAAGTVVVRTAAIPAPERLLPARERREMLFADYAAGERVRRVLRSPEKDLLVSLAVRRDRLEERARMRTFEEAARYFEGRLGIARPSTMSPETYILNLAAVAHAPREHQPAVPRR